MQIITVDENRCIGCNACVRVCPVHANKTRIKEGTDDEFVTTVDQNSCINCGECVKACKHGARGYNDHIQEFIKKYEAGEKLVIIVAPAVRTSFPSGEWKGLLKWIREHGNVKIYDVGFGADICTYMHNQYILKNPGKKVLTQPCPAVVNYVQKYQPKLINNLSPVLSPVGCLAVWLKKYQGVKDPLVMFSPCIAKTSEAEREHAYDYNVTFKHIEEYVKRKGLRLDLEFGNFQFDALEGGIGRMYPMPGGLKETLLMLNNDLVIRTAEGPQTLYDRLQRYKDTEEERKPDVLDVLNCQFGCNHGTALPESAASLMEVEAIMDDISARSIRETQGGFLGIGKHKRFKEFDKTLNLNDFLTSYKDESVKRQMPTLQDYQDIFKTMHKEDIISQSINCGACGYSSCKEMAKAIYLGMNVRENCVYYLKKSLKDSYKQLKSVYDACLEEIIKINTLSADMHENSSTVLSAADSISIKSAELSNNILRLQKFSQSCLDYYKKKDAVDLSSEDFTKMKQFIAAIGGMTQNYYDVAKDFEVSSGGIHTQVHELTTSLSSLTSLSEQLQEIMSKEK